MKKKKKTTNPNINLMTVVATVANAPKSLNRRRCVAVCVCTETIHVCCVWCARYSRLVTNTVSFLHLHRHHLLMLFWCVSFSSYGQLHFHLDEFFFLLSHLLLSAFFDFRCEPNTDNQMHRTNFDWRCALTSEVFCTVDTAS